MQTLPDAIVAPDGLNMSPNGATGTHFIPKIMILGYLGSLGGDLGALGEALGAPGKPWGGSGRQAGLEKKKL